MCGIGGILFSADAPAVLQQKIKQLGNKQQHRGPDGRSEWQAGNHALCHQRLALLDAAGGTQPFTDNSGRYLIVYNGELYNHAALRKQLEPQYQFTTRCDTEVVLAAYIRWGEKCLGHFNGMFAFLIWDTLTESAFAARDQAGIKPFVYCRQQQSFLFASEQKALLAVLNSRPALNEYALAEYVIAPYLSGDHLNLFQDIHFLQPGTFLRITRQHVTTHTWYRFQWQHPHIPEAALTQQVATALQQSVTQCLQADVPVGLFLSGGLDSSLLAGIAAHTGVKPDAYTITFNNHQHITFDPATIVNSDDLPWATRLAQQLQLPFTTVQAQHTSLQESLRQLAIINCRIPVWEQEFSQHFLSKAAATRNKAVLVGDAADETNYGYFFLLNNAVNHSPLALLQWFGADKRVQLMQPRLQKTLQPLTWLDAHYKALACAEGLQFGKNEQENILAMSAVVRSRWLQRLLHNGDIHTMHFGLEARVPFANRNVLDAVSQVTPASGFKNGQEKYIIRQAATRWLAADFSFRKKSALPRDPRLGKAYQPILKSLLQPNSSFIHTWLNKPALEALCNQQTITENDRMMLFNMISLLNWAQEYAA